MNVIGYLVIIAILIPIAIIWSIKKSKGAVSVSEYWRKKEEEYQEKKVLSAFSRYLGGHPRFEQRTEGLLFLMTKSLWFENFEKGPNIFGFSAAFEKVLIRLPLSRVGDVRSVPESELVEKGIVSTSLNTRRINRKPEYLAVDFHDEWGREGTLFFDTMVDTSTWESSVEKTLREYVPTEEESAVGACSKCGKKVSPDFKHCPYCGSNL